MHSHWRQYKAGKAIQKCIAVMHRTSVHWRIFTFQSTAEQLELDCDWPPYYIPITGRINGRQPSPPGGEEVEKEVDEELDKEVDEEVDKEVDEELDKEVNLEVDEELLLLPQ